MKNHKKFNAMNESKNKLKLAKKLKVLADKGVGGEKHNAEKLLQKLMKEHGIRLDQIENPLKEAHFFKYKNSSKDLLIQIIVMVCGLEVEIWRGAIGRNSFKIYCTELEFIEIQANFHFYSKAFEEEMKTFWKAFIHKNDLFPELDETKGSNSTPMDSDEIERLVQMMSGMKRHHYRKQLTS